MITLDTMRADRVGCYGHLGAATPTLDHVASQGVLFENCRTVAPLTLPAHASIMTGLLPPEHGVRVNGGYLPDSMPTLAELLKAQGYDTAAFIASPVLNAELGLSQGFDVYDDEVFRGEQVGRRSLIADPHDFYRTGDRVVDAAIDWLNSRAQVDAPLFCWVHLFDPHEPYVQHPDVVGRLFEHPYDAEIAFADKQIARLTEWLRAHDLVDQTLIVIVGDHGENLYEHGERTHSMTVYEGVLQVPFIIAGAGMAPRGRRIAAPVSVVDVAPTILELLGFPAAEMTQGLLARSLVGAIHGESLPSVPAYAETEEPYRGYGWAPLAALIQDEFKYIRSPIAELYDLASDPHELNNLAEAKPDLLAEMRDTLEQLLANVDKGDEAVSVVSAATRRQIQSLGYAGGAGAGMESGAVDESALQDVKTMLPVYEAAWNTLNAFELASDVSDEVLQDAQRLVRSSPETSRFHRILGMILLARGEFELAIASLEKAVAIHSGDVAALTNLGLSWCRMGRPVEAIDCFEKALAVAPDEPEIEAYLQNARWLMEPPSDAASLMAFADWLQEQGMLTVALAAVDRAVVAAPDSPNAYLMRGVIYEGMGRTADAVNAYQRALELDPDQGDARISVATILAQQGDMAAATRHCERVLESDPNSIMALHILANIALVEQQYATAIEIYEHVLAIDGDLLAARFNLANACLAVGQRERARIELERALEVASRHRQVNEITMITEALEKLNQGPAHK
ncbi:MAG: tetratricopeptide repeat protein [Verrucomicrobia bacterium]|nr:tetratricopeptide repeat protein [Verrucomicrobiota bacterium]